MELDFEEIVRRRSFVRGGMIFFFYKNYFIKVGKLVASWSHLFTSQALRKLKRCREYFEAISSQQTGFVHHSTFRAPVELRRMSAESLDPADEAIIDYVKCPGCRQFIQPPCVCCEQGHFMCTPCKARIEACPTCGATSFPNKVNAVFDRILQELYYPCVNAENGCHAFLKYSEISGHQSSCR